MMLFFASANNCLTRKMEARIRTLVSGSSHRFEACHRFDNLRRRLQRPGSRFSLAVLMVRNQEELDRLYGMRRLFCDLRLLLILPGGRQVAASTAHGLRPRFVTYFECGTEALTAVLGNMLAQLGQDGTEGP